MASSKKHRVQRRNFMGVISWNSGFYGRRKAAQFGKWLTIAEFDTKDAAIERLNDIKDPSGLNQFRVIFGKEIEATKGI